MPHRRTLPFLAALALALVALPITAQSAAAQRSDTRGFGLGVQLAGASLQYEDDTDDIESGSGFGLRLGYGVTQRVELFAELAGTALEVPPGYDAYGLGQLDLGARYNFRGPAAAARPYLSLAYATRVIMFEDESTRVELAGGGLSAGLGLRYFLTRGFALDAGLGIASGDATQGRLDGGDWTDLGDDAFRFTTTRLSLGISWHP